MTKTVDFDAFRAEREREPVEFLIDGQRYPMSPSLPAAIAVELAAMQAKHEVDDADDVPIALLDTIGVAVFGTEVWKSLLDRHRIGVDELPELVQAVIGIYSPQPTDPPPAST